MKRTIFLLSSFLLNLLSTSSYPMNNNHDDYFEENNHIITDKEELRKLHNCIRNYNDPNVIIRYINQSEIKNSEEAQLIVNLIVNDNQPLSIIREILEIPDMFELSINNSTLQNNETHIHHKQTSTLLENNENNPKKTLNPVMNLQQNNDDDEQNFNLLEKLCDDLDYMITCHNDLINGIAKNNNDQRLSEQDLVEVVDSLIKSLNTSAMTYKNSVTLRQETKESKLNQKEITKVNKYCLDSEIIIAMLEDEDLPLAKAFNMAFQALKQVTIAFTQLIKNLNLNIPHNTLDNLCAIAKNFDQISELDQNSNNKRSNIDLTPTDDPHSNSKKIKTDLN